MIIPNVTGNQVKLGDVKKTLLVGAGGFVGKTLLSRQNLMDHQYLLLDTRRDQNTSESLIEETQAAIWCASRTNPLLASHNPALVELEFSEWENFIHKLITVNYEGKVVFLSSGGCVYSDGDLPFREGDKSEGTNDYGRMKIRMEKQLEASQLDYRILRVSNLYGPGQEAGKGQGVIAEWTNQITAQGIINVIGSKENTRDFLHIDDLASAIERTLTKHSDSGIYNIGSGKRISLKEIIQILKMHSKSEFQVLESPARSFDRTGYSLNIEKFTSTFSWSPSIAIDEGLRNMLSPGKSNV